MKIKHPKLLQYISIFCILLGSFSISGGAYAASPGNFGVEYGLMVHKNNQDQTVSKLKGLQVLNSYFPDSKINIDPGSIGFLSQREFLLWFEKLRLDSEGKTIELSDDELYLQTWLRVRRSNLLPQTRLTYKSLQEFLYRYSISKEFDGRPYFEGLVLDDSEITTHRFSSIRDVRRIKGELFSEILYMKSLGVLSGTDRLYFKSISSNYESFKDVEDGLKILKHPFSIIPDMPPEIRQIVIENNLNEILGSISYDYSHNLNYRKHNLVTGTKQIHGRLYQPGDLINFTDVLAANGWNQYRFGWVIFEGEDKWQFGGGLCGSATMAFTPSWQSGLEIVQRYPHSAYYKNLYPEESFGLDATIYRGSKNLVMKNNTNDPILYYVVDDTEQQKITLYIIGNSPYFNIEIEGPIKLGWNTYKWIRRMEQFDGKVVEDELTTRYGAVY